MTATTWIRESAEELAHRGEGALPELERRGCRLEDVDPPWILFLGREPEALARAAAQWIGENAGGQTVLRPPDTFALPVVVQELSSPGLAGPRVLHLPTIERAFYDNFAEGSLSLTSPLYLLPKLAHLASEGERLTVVATAVETELLARGDDVSKGRSLASRFEIRREVGDVPAPSAFQEIEAARLDEAKADGADARRFLELAIATRSSELRTKALKHALSMSGELALTHFLMGAALAERRQLPGAVAAFRKAIALDPSFDAARYELGKVLVRTGDMDGALAAFRETTELLPAYASAWSNLGAALGEMEDTEGAEAALLEAVALDPFSHALHSNLGVTYRDQGKLEEAEAEFLKVVEMAPEWVFGHYNLASVYYLQARYAEAIELFGKARSLDRSGSARQGLMLAIARLASGDVEGALADYRDVFSGLDAQMKPDMRTVAEWDLKRLAERLGVSPALREAAALLRKLA